MGGAVAGSWESGARARGCRAGWAAGRRQRPGARQEGGGERQSATSGGGGARAQLPMAHTKDEENSKRSPTCPGVEGGMVHKHIVHPILVGVEVAHLRYGWGRYRRRYRVCHQHTRADTLAAGLSRALLSSRCKPATPTWPDRPPAIPPAHDVHLHSRPTSTPPPPPPHPHFHHPPPGRCHTPSCGAAHPSPTHPAHRQAGRQAGSRAAAGGMAPRSTHVAMEAIALPLPPAPARPAPCFPPRADPPLPPTPREQLMQLRLPRCPPPSLPARRTS